MSVHQSRGAWEVRWRESGGRARSKRFHDEPQANAFDAAVKIAKLAGDKAERGASESIYPYRSACRAEATVPYSLP